MVIYKVVEWNNNKGESEGIFYFRNIEFPTLLKMLAKLGYYKVGKDLMRKSSKPSVTLDIAEVELVDEFIKEVNF